MHYKLTLDTEVVQRMPDGGFQRIDSPEYLAWVGNGNIAAPAETLEETKYRALIAVNVSRMRANQGSFSYAGKEIACDALSRSDIDGVASYVALNATLPPGFPGAWKATDNSYVSIPDVVTFKALIEAMVIQGATNFAHAQALKAQIAAATTAEQVAEVVW